MAKFSSIYGLFIVLVVLIVLLIASPSVHGKKNRLSSHPLCKEMQGQSSVLWPFICMTNEEYASLGRFGKEYVSTNQVRTLDPVLLVPGLGGSGLEAKLVNAKGQPHWYCYQNLDWFRTWLALGSLIGGYADCWYHNMAIFYDPATDSYHYNQGVSSRAIDYGGLRGVDYLNTDLFGEGISLTAYFAPLIKELQGAGYVAGKSLRAAPYDWRLPEDPDNYYERTKALIEQMYAENGNSPVHIVAHSMGNIHVSYMFTFIVDQAWKDKYIASFVSVAAPWSGSPKALRALISGDNFGIGFGDWFSLVDAKKIAKLVRQSGGLVMMLPEVDYWNSTPIVHGPSRSYGVADFKELFEDIGTPITGQILESLNGLLGDIQAPGVNLHCLYGIQYPTEYSFKYKDWNSPPEITYTEEGDGTVPDISLRRCNVFKTQQTQPVAIIEFDLADHTTVLNDEGLIQYILDLVTR